MTRAGGLHDLNVRTRGSGPGKSPLIIRKHIEGNTSQVLENSQKKTPTNRKTQYLEEIHKTHVQEKVYVQKQTKQQKDFIKIPLLNV